MAPMGEELAAVDGTVSPEQLAYVEARAAGGAALVTLGSVAVAWPLGTSNERQNGISGPEHEAGLRALADAAHRHGAKLGLQLSHMGKVARNDIVAGRPMWVPSLPGRGRFDPLIAMLTDDEMAKSLAPMQAPGARVEFHEMTHDDITTVIEWFASAVERARACGVDAIEFHAGHGYLLDEFLSPSSNKRTDAYGGNFENRIRFPMQIFKAVRAAFPGVLGMRLSATDWVDNGWTPEETADFAARLKQEGANFVHISTAGVAAQQKIPVGPEFQVPFAKLVKDKTGLPTIAVGLITDPHRADDIIKRGDADLVGLARSFLYKPRWMWEAAAALQGTVEASPQYWRSLPREAQTIFGPVRVGQR